MKLVVVIAMLVAGCSDPRSISEPCDGPCTTGIHPAGILDPTSPEFHGKELRKRNYDFGLCATCHGTDFGGGSAGVSCTSCHVAGPTACSTCHGTGPTSNAHTRHAARDVPCASCHVVPAAWNTDGHILHDGITITTPPKVVFAGTGTYDGTSCTNTYCHGATLHGGVATSPRWSDSPTGSCDRCHGNPPPSHARKDCATCHPASAPHVDGIVQIGRDATCSGCHGNASSPAPPTDLAGNQFTTAIGVGAHRAHLEAPSRLSAPIACATCHQVPAAVDSPGHIDSIGPAIVNASLGWDRASETCTTSGCHGPARPTWTSSGSVACGSCHGVPPVDANHTPAMSLTSCATCHPGTVDAFGNIIVASGASKHINGVVDL